MAKDKELPSEENSHEDNVKISLETILNQKVKSRKTKKTPEDLRKDAFVRAIIALEHASVRENVLLDFGIDLEIYDEVMYDATDAFIEMLFTPNQRKFIDFYIYNRHDENGDLVPVEAANGQEILLTDPGILYELLKAVK
jgi:hypothetical protein